MDYSLNEQSALHPQNGNNGNSHIPIHALATIFPPMTDAEFAALKSDISEHGVHQPVAVWRGEIIDGRNRYLAAEELGIKAPLRYLDDDVDPVSYVLSSNMSRRNLDPSQRAIVMAALPKLEPGHPATKNVVETIFPVRQTDRAARAAVTKVLQSQADAIYDFGDQNLIMQIRSGQLTVTDAYKSIHEAKRARAAAAKAKQDRIAAEKALDEAATNLRTAMEFEQEVIEKARQEHEAAEREAAEQAEREATEQARVEKETSILRAAQQQCSENPGLTLTAAAKEQRRKYTLRSAQDRGDRSPYINGGGEIDLSSAMPVGRHSRVVFADNLDPENGLPSLPDEVAALTFTSPPYWTFAKYGDVGIGYEASYPGYIESLRRVFAAIWQKTLPGGKTIVNVSNMKSRHAVEGAAFVYPIVADLIRAMDGIGFTFFDEIIWHKRDTTTRPMNGAPLWGSYPYPPTPKILDSTFENILVFNKPGNRKVDTSVKEQSRLTMEEWREYTKGVWRIESGNDPNHPATFPMELADRIIRMYSFVNDVVIDPFAGTGTTILSAERNARAGVGYEIAPMYKTTLEEKAEYWLEVI